MNKTLRNIIYSMLSCLVLFTGCDKVEDDSRLIFAGAAGKWVEGQGVSDHSQRVFLEKYTGPRCPNCPRADIVIADALNKYGDKLIAVSIHDSSFFGKPYPGSIDLRTEDGDTWSNVMGMKDAEKPKSLINRNKSGETFTQYQPTSNMDDVFDAELANTPAVAIAADAAIRNDSMNIDVNLEFLQEVASPLTLTVLIIEDNLITTQNDNGDMNTGYVNNHILRDVITDVWGSDVDADGHAGTKRFCRLTYKPNSDWVMDNCHIVAFISDKSTRHILNSVETEIKQTK